MTLNIFKIEYCEDGNTKEGKDLVINSQEQNVDCFLIELN